MRLYSIVASPDVSEVPSGSSMTLSVYKADGKNVKIVITGGASASISQAQIATALNSGGSAVHTGNLVFLNHSDFSGSQALFDACFSLVAEVPASTTTIFGQSIDDKWLFGGGGLALGMLLR